MKVKYCLAAVLMAVVSGVTVSCSNNEAPEEGIPGPGTEGGTTPEEVTMTVSGDVSGVWEKNSVVRVAGDIRVPQGSALTIEEGVKVLFDAEGVLNGDRGYEFIVAGNLYCKGTETAPVLMSVGEGLRTEELATEGLWGGIIATETCEEMLIDHAVIEYTGSDVTESSPSATLGIYSAGEDAGPQVTVTNINGRYVLTNSVFRYGASDAIYMMGGRGIITGNVFAVNGDTGGEAVNVKAGCRADVAFNLMYSPNTNGLKLSSSGQDDAAGRTQAKIRAYNNTIVNAGWRRDGNKGGCVYVEKNASANVFNNLMVNCKFKAQTPNWGTPGVKLGAALDCVIDYNYYIAGTQASTMDFDLEDGTASAFGNLSWTGSEAQVVFPQYIDVHSRQSATAGGTDPMFVNYAYLADGLHNKVFNDVWDFHVQAGSPVLAGGAYDGADASMQPLFGTVGINVGGVDYRTPSPAARYGAYGTN